MSEQRHRELYDLLQGEYVRARDAISKAEALSDELQVDGITNLRDAMDFIHLALKADTETDAQERLKKADQALQQGAIKSLQGVADKEFLKSEQLAEKNSRLLRFTRYSLPQECDKEELRTHQALRDDYADLQQQIKKDGDSLDHVPQLEKIIQRFHDRLDCLPEKRHLYGLILYRTALLIAVIVLIVLAIS